jgi:hypothetical protein
MENLTVNIQQNYKMSIVEENKKLRNAIDLVHCYLITISVHFCPFLSFQSQSVLKEH